MTSSQKLCNAIFENTSPGRNPLKRVVAQMVYAHPLRNCKMNKQSPTRLGVRDSCSHASPLPFTAHWKIVRRFPSSAGPFSTRLQSPWFWGDAGWRGFFHHRVDDHLKLRESKRFFLECWARRVAPQNVCVIFHTISASLLHLRHC